MTDLDGEKRVNLVDKLFLFEEKGQKRYMEVQGETRKEKGETKRERERNERKTVLKVTVSVNMYCVKSKSRILVG